jgi:choline dehydrogenase-like flavoprotein
VIISPSKLLNNAKCEAIITIFTTPKPSNTGSLDLICLDTVSCVALIIYNTLFYPKVNTMSPIKRALDERYPEAGGAYMGSSPKRLRGGGGDNDDDDEEWGGGGMGDEHLQQDELFDDDLVSDEQAIPEDVDVKPVVAVSEGQNQRWKRPACNDWSRTKDRHVQWLDMDVVSGKPLSQNPNTNKKQIVGSVKGMVPILRCFGVDDDGHSMALFIHGFTPYSYFALPEGYELDQSNGDSNLAAIRDALTLRLESAARGAAAQSAVVLGVTYVTDHKSIMGFDTPHTKFLKIYVSLPGLVATLKRIMEEGINLPGIKATATGSAANNTMMPVYQAFECNVPFVLRFMVDRDVGGAGWLTMPGETYQIRELDKKETHCQVSGRMHETID